MTAFAVKKPISVLKSAFESRRSDVGYPLRRDPRPLPNLAMGRLQKFAGCHRIVRTGLPDRTFKGSKV